MTIDPSPNHNTACALHDSHTGTWITRSDEYQEWKNGSSRLFWLHGIPGAGKTILFSYVVEDIQQYCKTFGSKDITCSYYYCYFGRAQDEVPHILQWVINQLCRKSQYIPKAILDSFQTGRTTFGTSSYPGALGSSSQFSIRLCNAGRLRRDARRTKSVMLAKSTSRSLV